MYLFVGNERARAFIDHSKNDLDYFSNRRWRLVQLLEEYSGCWPYQSKLKQLPLKLLHFFGLCSILSAVANKLRDIWGVDDEITIECILAMAFITIIVIKVIFAAWHQRVRSDIYERVAEHLKQLSGTEEATILSRFADQGFKYTAVFGCTVCITVSVYDIVPIIQTYYYYYFVSGELDYKFPIPLKYSFDHETYWYVIVIDFLLFVYSGIVVDLAYDLSFILQIRHIQALFKIIGVRLRKASELVSEFEDDPRDDQEAAADKAYSLISSAIDLHSECLDMVNIIEDCYTSSWFIILLINTGMFTAATHLMSLRIRDPIETMRYFFAYIMILMHFQIIFSQGQRIIDSSATVADFCYDCKWYNLPKKSSKLLTTMMIRTSKPCRITGAQLFPLSIQSFGKMLKAGISYYTVFES